MKIKTTFVLILHWFLLHRWPLADPLLFWNRQIISLRRSVRFQSFYLLENKKLLMFPRFHAIKRSFFFFSCQNIIQQFSHVAHWLLQCEVKPKQVAESAGVILNIMQCDCYRWTLIRVCLRPSPTPPGSPSSAKPAGLQQQSVLHHLVHAFLPRTLPAEQPPQRHSATQPLAQRPSGQPLQLPR